MKRTLSHILTSEDRVVRDADGNFSHHEYNLKDHLGNTRVVFTEDDGVIKNNDYYPFGMLMGGADAQPVDGDNKFLYNGKEYINNTDLNLSWYDYGARFYDPQLGRWHSVDPMATERISISPYNYCQNNPILRIDTNGMLDGDFFDEDLNKIGTDGKNDGQNYVVTNKTDITTITTNDGAGKTTQLSDLTADATELPNDVVIKEMGNAVAASEVDQCHEEGGTYGSNQNGPLAVPAKPAASTTPPIVDPINVLDAADPSLVTSDYVIEGTYHVHASKIVTEGGYVSGFDDIPSRADVENAYLRAQPVLSSELPNNKPIKGNNYVLAPRTNKVSVYNHKDFEKKQRYHKQYNLTKFLNLAK